MDAEMLKKLQNTELGIMVDIDSFCIKHNISYSLYAGTLIGAIRHKGFIPWDDDIDICMDRKEYERFLNIWEETGGIDGYYLQSSRNLDKTNINFTKVRKDGTAFISRGETGLCDHNGIWVDIFPLERVPQKSMPRKMVKFYAMLWLVYTRNFPYTLGSKFLRLLSEMMLLLPKKLKRKLQHYCEEKVTQYQHLEDGYDLVALYGPQAMKLVFPQNSMDEFIRVPFEDAEFSVTKEYDTMLRVHYGDYMQLPPEEDRICKHQPQEIRF